MTKMFLRYVSAAVLLVIVSVSAAQAQKMFKVCRGEDIARCGGTDVNAFIGCSDVKSFAQNACPAETGVNSIFLRSTVPGNQCGYSHYDVTCNPEIAPRSVLTTAGAVLGLLFAIVSLVSVTWMLGARSKEASAVQADVPTMAKSDLGNLVRWISIVGGMVGLIVSALAFYYRFFQDTTIQKLGLLDWLIVPAFAQDNAAKPENWFKLYTALGVLILMGTAFLVALGTLMRLPDSKINQTRIKAADNIVKMFGGFFTGLATTLLTKI